MSVFARISASPHNEAIKAVTKEGNTLVSRYDSEGLRYEIEENEKLSRFIFHKDNVLVETDKNYNVISRFARGYEVVSADIKQDSPTNCNLKCTPKDDDLERYFYIVDEQGSTTLITNNSADIANEYYYDAFGNVLESKEDIHNRITYMGQQFDNYTQQYYLRARFYNPSIGRFTQEDIYRGDGLNLYAYCRNNPVMYYDPSGYVCDSKKTSFNTEGGSKTGTVWDNIKATQDVYPNTNIPKSFEVDVNGQKMWVHGNATEHIYEDVYKGMASGNGTAFTNHNLYTQELMNDFYGALEQATKSGITYGEKINSGNWEFIFAKPRQEGQLPVIKHSMFNGWH